MSAVKALIVGAGVVGLATALELQERGAEVTIYERHDTLAGSASWLAGGMLAPFCEGESAPESVVIRGAEAIDWWARHVPEVVREGSLVVAQPRDVADLDRFAAHTREWEKVDEARIGALEPELAGRFRKGLFYAKEGHVDPRVALAALLAELRAAGAQVWFGVDYHAGAYEGTVVIDCRGYAARADLPEIRAVRGEMMLVRTHEVKLGRPVRMLHPRIPLYIAPRADGVFMIGATMIESADPTGVSVRSTLELLGAAYALHPAFGEAEVLEMKAALRPSYPDNEPRIVEANGRIYVNGFYRHGYLLAPFFAKAVADRVFGVVV